VDYPRTTALSPPGQRHAGLAQAPATDEKIAPLRSMSNSFWQARNSSSSTNSKSWAENRGVSTKVSVTKKGYNVLAAKCAVLLTLDKSDFGILLGTTVYGMLVSTPRDFLIGEGLG